MALKRQKILFLNHVAVLGGAEISLLETVTALRRAGHECAVAVPSPGEMADALAREGVAVHFLPFRRFKRTLDPFVLATNVLNVVCVVVRLAALIRRENVGLVYSNSNTAHIYGGAAAMIAGVPCVWHSRDLVELGILGRWMFFTATKVVAVSQAVNRHLRCYGPASGIVTVRNGIDPGRFGGTRNGPDLRDETGIEREAFVVGMAGQFVPWKSHALFLRAAALIAREIPGARFLIAGGNLFGEAPQYEGSLRDLARELGIGDRVVFTGHLRDMARFYACINVLIHPADREPLGRVILEAMAAGRPVVAVNKCGPSETVRDGIDGVLVRPGDVSAMAKAAIALWTDRGLAVRMGSAGRERIRGSFSLAGQAARIGEVCSSLMRGDARRPVGVAYVVAGFPSVTETFILREMTALEDMGLDVHLFALSRLSGGVVHPSALPFLRRVRFRSGSATWRVLAGQAYFFMNAPRRHLGLWRHALLRGDPDDGSRLKAVYHLLTAAEFALAARRLGVSHVHAHFAFVTADIGLMMAGLLGIRCSISVHAWDIYTRKKEAIAARTGQASFVMTCTDHGRTFIEGAGQGGARTFTMRHGVFPRDFSAAAPVGPLILGVGRLEEKKGFGCLIEACGILKRAGTTFSCVIVGDGKLRRSIMEQISSADLKGEVLLTGELDEERLRDLYGRTTVVVVPSVVGRDGDRDGMSNVVVEAMAMRIPVVATHASAASEVIEDGVQGLIVPPGDPRAIADSLQRLLADEAERLAMGARGRDAVEREFDVARNVGILAGLFTEASG
jgi:glycosyltransferase involved in cell wall biosynthesis